MDTFNNKTRIGFLFDLDGVLIDSETQYTRIWQEIDNIHPTGVEDFAYRIKGTTLDNILSTYYPEPSTQKKIRLLLYDKEGAMHYGYTPGAEEFLEKLSARGHKVVLVTSSNEDKMNKLWKQHPEMKKRFISIVTGDKVTRSKPDPEGYLLGASLTGASPTNCVVFEDSLQGVKAGKAAGCYVVGVSGTVSRDRLAEYADIIIDTLNEVDLIKIEKILIER